jgi:hypothetical protein
VAVEKADPGLLETAMAEPHVDHVNELVMRLKTRVETLKKEHAASTDDRKREQLLVEVRSILRTLRWLPDAAGIPALPVRFASRSHKRGTIAIGTVETIKRPLRLQRYVLDTSDPIEIAALRYHMQRGVEPTIEEVPPGFVPSFVGGRRQRFYGFVPQEMANEAILSGAANVILP